MTTYNVTVVYTVEAETAEDAEKIVLDSIDPKSPPLVGKLVHFYNEYAVEAEER